MTLYVWDNREDYSGWSLTFIETDWPADVVARAMRYNDPNGCIVAHGPKDALLFRARGEDDIGKDLRPVPLEEAMRIYELPSAFGEAPEAERTRAKIHDLPAGLLAAYARRMLAVDEDWLSRNRSQKMPIQDTHVATRIEKWKTLIEKLSALPAALPAMKMSG